MKNLAKMEKFPEISLDPQPDPLGTQIVFNLAGNAKVLLPADV